MQRHDDIPIHLRPVLPDRELLLWEKWIKIRKDETTHLAKMLDRSPLDLAMNALVKVRGDKERKTALEHAQIAKKIGPRGSLWDQPPRLKQRCYCSPVYELHRTQAEVGRPKVIQHIGVPTYLQQTELGMAGESQRVPCFQLNAEYMNYRDQREEELYEQLKKIDPYRPDLEELIVKGRQPPTPPRRQPPVPEITIEEPTNFQQPPLSGVYALKINETVFYIQVPERTLDYLPMLQKDSSHKLCTSWTYYFNVPIKRAGRSKLFLQNLGTVTLRYCWKKIKHVLPFIPDDYYKQVFFFNKNENVIFPGQNKEIFFTFISDKPGIYHESWEFSTTNICFFDSLAEKLIINLYADSVENIDTIKRKVDIIKTRISTKAIHNLVVEFINEIFDNVFTVVPQNYPYKKFFLEGEIFVMKNPVCFYHQTEVAKMKELYTEMKPKEDWDLSIATWRSTMMKNEFDDRMKYYDLLKKSHVELLKPWYEGQSLLEEKYRTMKCFLKQFVSKFDIEYINIRASFFPRSEVGGSLRSKSKSKSMIFDSVTEQMVHNIFFMRIYAHFVYTIELCAGVLSSLDLNRWIDFDFCRHYN